MCRILFSFILILFVSLSVEFECQLKEESIVGTVLTDILNGRPCNILQKRSLSFNTIQILMNKITVKILPIQENRISNYFEIINNDDLKYSLNSKNDHLRIGDIRVKKPIDRESLCGDIGKCCDSEPFCFFELKVLVRVPSINSKISYSSSEKISSTMTIETIRIKIIDINDNSPHFSQPVKTIEISESIQIGAKIPLPLAVDEDSKNFNIISYRLENHEHALFTLIPEWSNFDSMINQIFLKLLQPIDRENVSMYNLNLIATDKGKPSLSGKLKIEIKILDANDNQPIFENSTYIVNVKESEISGHLILLLKATDKDSGENGLVMYYFSSDVTSEVRKKFHIDSSTGWVSISETLDYEKVKYYTFNVIARDSGTDAAFSKATVKVSVVDCNDNPPKIYLEYVTDSGKRTLIEGPTTINKEYSIVIVSDPDSGNGGLVQCDLKGSQKFILVPPNNREGSTWKINLVESLDYEERNVERFIIVCHDRGEPQLTSSHEEEIIIRDINDNSPIFEHPSYHQTVEENNQAGIVVLKVVATDRDSDLNGKINYSIDSLSVSYFSIDPVTGTIRSKISFDREKRASYQLSVFARDFGEPAQSGSANVLITITDQNDNTPYFQGLNGGGSYIFEIKENGPSNAIIGTIHAEDPDEGINGQVLYTFLSPVEKFTIHPDQGIIRTNQQLDRENKAVHEFSVRVIDKGILRQENSVSVTVSVIDENDNEPRFVIPTNDSTSVKISYLDTAGTLVARIEAIDKDEGPNSHLDYQIISGNSRDQTQDKIFFMDQKNGDIFLQRALTRQDMGVYILKMMVSDQGNPPRKSYANYVIKIDNSAQRSQTLNNMKYNQNQHATYSDRSRDDSLSTSVILIVSIALICIIVLVLLTLAVFLCGKRGQEELNEILFKNSDRGETSANLHFCFCLSKSRNPRKPRSDSHRFSEMLYNNYSVLPKTFKAASDIDDSGFRKENNFGTLIHKDRGNSTGSLMIEKNSQTKPTECQSYQMANFRKEFNPEFNLESRYISFQGTTDSRTVDEYTTLVNNKINQANYQKLQRKLENENRKSPSTKYGNSSIDPIVYIRCSSTPGNNDTISDSEKPTKPGPATQESLSPLFRNFQSGDLLYPFTNCSKSKTLSSRTQQKNRHAKQLKSHFRYPSVPESLNYLSVGSNSGIDIHENPSRLITWEFGKKIKSTPLHKGSFV